MKRILPFIIILAGLAVTLLGTWYLTRPSTTPAAPVPVAPGTPTSNAGPTTPAVSVAADAPGAQPPHRLGPDSARVKLEEFGDFQCPPCGMLHPILKQMHQEFGNDLQITFREFPLVPGHQHALAAANAAEAAALQGKFWEMHGLIYEHQKEWKDVFDARPIFEGYAKQLGLNMQRYQNDLDSDLIRNRVFEDGKRGYALKLKGTPTVFMNGRELPFASLMDPAKLREEIKAELARTK